MTNLVKLELTKTILKASHSSVDSRTSCVSEQGAFQRIRDWSQFISLAFDCLRAEPHLFAPKINKLAKNRSITRTDVTERLPIWNLSG